MSDSFIRIIFEGEQQDINYSSQNNISNAYVEVDYTDNFGNAQTANASYVWRMIAVNFKRAY
jgi:hypothetical protein